MYKLYSSKIIKFVLIKINKPPFLLTKNVVGFDQYELDYLGQIKFLHVEMPY